MRGATSASSENAAGERGWWKMPKTSLKSKSVYIGNAPYTTTEADLHEMFSNVGECSIRFPPTEHSRVIAFADYGTHEEAVRAAVKFHDTLMGDRGLR